MHREPQVPVRTYGESTMPVPKDPETGFCLFHWHDTAPCRSEILFYRAIRLSFAGATFKMLYRRGLVANLDSAISIILASVRDSKDTHPSQATNLVKAAAF